MHPLIFFFLGGAGGVVAPTPTPRRPGYGYNPLYRYPVRGPQPQEVITVLELHDAHREGELIAVVHLDAATRTRHRVTLDGLLVMPTALEALVAPRRYAALDGAMRASMHLDADTGVFDGGALLLTDALEEVEA